MYISRLMEQLVVYAMAIIWIGVGAVLLYRARIVAGAYLRLFEPETSVVGAPNIIVRSIREYWVRRSVMREPQIDRGLERERREIWRRLRYQVLWMIGFPPFAGAVVAVLVAMGLVRLA